MGNGFSRSREGTDFREEQSNSENQGLSRQIFDMLRIKNKRSMIGDEFYIEKAVNIVKLEYKNINEEHANLLKRKHMLELVKKIISMNKSSYKEIIRDIYENIEKIEEEGNIKQDLFIHLGNDMKCAFPEGTGSNLRSVESGVKDEISKIKEQIEKKEINIEFLKQNKEYQEYKQIISNEIEKYKEQIREVEEKIKYINVIKSTISDPILYKRIGEFIFQEKMKDFNKLQNKVMKKYYKLSDAITRLGDETGLIPSKLEKPIRFDPNSKRVGCLHADDPDWSAYEKRMKDLKYGLDSLKNAKWYQDYQKNLKNKLETYGENLDKLRGMDLDNSSEIEKCMEDVASLEEKINEVEQHCGFHPDVIQNCPEYRKMIHHFRVDLGKRFWEDEV
jgi:hypothetical protein